MTWFDTHFHIHPEDDDAPDEILTAARAEGVSRFLILGTSLTDCDYTTALADPQHGVYAAAGMHPHTAETYDSLEPFQQWLARPGVIAVGEIGLDYFYDFANHDAQKRVLEIMLALAHDRALPAVIHCRSAFQDCYDIVRNTIQPGDKILIHSFADSPKEAELWLKLGAYMSVNGMVTFNKADNIRESLAHIPMDRLLLETDSPYLAPVPNRGKRNTPAYLPLIGQRVAKEKGMTPDEVAHITTQNALTFFNLK